jgi:hypothetical protein
MAINEGEVGRAVRRDSPWWSDAAWVDRDRDLRAAEQSGLNYNPTPLDGMVADGLYLPYGPRRVGKTVSIKRTIQRLLSTGVDPLRVVRVSGDGWKANRLGTLHDYVTRVATTWRGAAKSSVLSQGLSGPSIDEWADDCCEPGVAAFD